MVTDVKSTRLDAALRLARQGFRIFPLQPNSKVPAIQNWRTLANVDEGLITQWWGQDFPNANIGLITDGLCVIDIDPRNGGEGSWDALMLAEDIPDTLTAQTQSGGTHMLFTLPAGMTVPNSKGRLGPGIDIKAIGGYIVAAGSEIDGRPYKWFPGFGAGEIEAAPAPQWLLDQAKAPIQRTAAAGKRVAQEDDETIARAVEYMAERAPNAEEGKRDNTAFAICAKLFDLGVTEDTALDLLNEWNEHHCVPPLDDEDIERVVRSAQVNRSRAIGSASPNAPGFEAVEIAPRIVPDMVTVSVETGSRLTGRMIRRATATFSGRAIEPRAWVVRDFLMKRYITFLVGSPGAGKSTYGLQLALAIVTGREDICGFPIAEPGPVLLWNQEDDIDELQRGLQACKTAFGVGDAEYDNLFMESGVERPLTLAKRTMEGGFTPGDGMWLEQQIKANGIKTVILDPFVELHEANENDNMQMRTVLSLIRPIAVRCNCAILIVVHTGKPPQASSDGFANNMWAARGASSQLGVVRVFSTLETASAKDAKKWSFEGGEYLDHVRLDRPKLKFGKRPNTPQWFRKESVNVGAPDNPDSVGVLRPVILRERGHTSSDDLLAILARIVDEKFERDKFYKVTPLIDAMDDDKKELFGARSHWARKVAAAFEGEEAYMTDLGKMSLGAGSIPHIKLGRKPGEFNPIT